MPSQRPASIALLLALAAAVAIGCDGASSVLQPAGRRAAAIADLTWLMTIIAVAVFALVLGVLAWAIWRGSRDGEPSRLGSRRLVVAGGIVLPAVVLPLVYLVSLSAMAGLAERGPAGSPEIDLVARQWGYEARYANGATLTNEVRIPVGQPVLLRLHSEDVIHSFWVPRLGGKQDFIPGHVNEVWIEASEPGVYPGRCAEFCGIGHAHMELRVIAQPAAEFSAWLAGQGR